LRRWIPDKSIVPLMDSVHSDAGYNVAEDLVGTNGVGTVVETGRATQISGPEHLSPVLSTFTCVGAPIHHPITRRLEGVITLSCLSDASNALLTPLLTSTAREIEHRILDQASVRERLLLDAYLKASKTRRGPVAAVGNDLFLAGPQVTEFLRDVDQAMLWEYVRAVAGGARVSESHMATLAAQLQLSECHAIQADGQVVGAIVEFDVPSRDVRSSERHRPKRKVAVLPGKSASLAHAVAQASRYAAAGSSMLVEGERGVGKTTLVDALVGSGSLVARFDLAGVDPGTFTAELRAALERRVHVVILLHLECLQPDVAAVAASLLEEFTSPDWTPRVVATMTPAAEPAPAGRARLIDLIAAGRVVIPPLRDRREDISEAAAEMVTTHGNDRTVRISPAAMRTLMRAPWPGNLRQLETTIRGVLATTSNYEVGPADLPAQLLTHAHRRQLSPMEELELNAILDALQRHHGNKLAAANAIGISRSTLYRKLRSYHVDPDRMYF
ncbi:MAG: sigma-54 dependent transcriptional regulator, acetoin dehydrogenase operon transcriptional, partial [Pseudonocardiales bacterium]|nr:sigma-54 dependent transcriptional regulator, acetoin dehydrogenase operon transcriptional [Pseudonocardiales bacterium]